MSKLDGSDKSGTQNNTDSIWNTMMPQHTSSKNNELNFKQMLPQSRSQLKLPTTQI